MFNRYLLNIQYDTINISINLSILTIKSNYGKTGNCIKPGT